LSVVATPSTAIDLAVAFGVVAGVMLFLGLRLGRYLERQAIKGELLRIRDTLDNLKITGDRLHRRLSCEMCQRTGRVDAVNSTSYTKPCPNCGGDS
jgi:hypothetical protein